MVLSKVTKALKNTYYLMLSQTFLVKGMQKSFHVCEWNVEAISSKLDLQISYYKMTFKFFKCGLFSYYKEQWFGGV